MKTANRLTPTGRLKQTGLICLLLCLGLFGCHENKQLSLPEPEPIPVFPVPAAEKSVPMGDPDTFELVRMDFPMFKGPFEPSWESIHEHYGDYPAWLRESKFGIWVHFGPQASGMSGDWYARRMYVEEEQAYKNHLRDYGHPALEGNGYKDLLRTWNPGHYNPEELTDLYYEAGARFLFIQGVHHDNYDLWDSKYQSWNSVNLGPKRDFLAEWAKAVRAKNMYFGVTFHHEYTWWWWESAFRSDSAGSYAGIPYDGKLVYESKKQQAWYEQYDIKRLYGVNLREYEGVGISRYAPEKGIFSKHLDYAHWYANNWALRILDVINKYDPDFIYTDGNDTQPFSGKKSGTGYKCDAPQRVIASYYNQALANHGKIDVFSIVKFHPAGRRGIVTTFEGKFPRDIKTDQAWIGENPIGDWYYAPDFVYSADAVIRFLLECVSRDGAYAVSVPIRPDGSLEEECKTMLAEIGSWMKINGEGVYGSKAWKKAGEGKDGTIRTLPGGKISQKQAEFQFSPADFRFTEGKQGDLYVFCMTIPAPGTELKIYSLGNRTGLLDKKISAIHLLGCKSPVKWEINEEALSIVVPAELNHHKTALCFKLQF